MWLWLLYHLFFDSRLTSYNRFRLTFSFNELSPGVVIRFSNTTTNNPEHPDHQVDWVEEGEEGGDEHEGGEVEEQQHPSGGVDWACRNGLQNYKNRPQIIRNIRIVRWIG